MEIFFSWLILLLVIFFFGRKRRKRNVKRFNGSPNARKECFYRANEDVLEGVEICASLQFRTCLVCGVLDGTRYKFNERVPSLPLHPGCCCVLLPVTPLSDFIEDQRPAEMIPVAYFAEQRYNVEKRKKQFAELAEATQRKYYHAEEKMFIQRGVKVWQQFSGNYTQWFNSLPAEYQKIIVGEKRFGIMKKKHLPLAALVDLQNLREYTVEELERIYK